MIGINGINGTTTAENMKYVNRTGIKLDWQYVLLQIVIHVKSLSFYEMKTRSIYLIRQRQFFVSVDYLETISWNVLMMKMIRDIDQF